MIAPLPLVALPVYLDHLVTGRGVRELARDHGMDHPSTVLRRIRTLEDWRDGPEREEILDRLEADWPSWPVQTAPHMSRVLRVFGFASVAEVDAALAPLTGPLVPADRMAITQTGLAKAAIVAPRADPVSIPRDALLAGIVLGRVVNGLKPGRYLRASPHPAVTGPGRINGSARRVIEGRPDMFTAGRRRVLDGVSVALQTGQADDAASVLPPAILAALSAFLVGRSGLTAFESRLGLPPRSGKGVLSILADILDHRAGGSHGPE